MSEIFKMLDSFFNKKVKNIHLLHIGKTGGTSLIKMIESISTTNYKIIVHSHDYNFKDVPKNEKVIFFLRKPHDRFVSGFYSRKRMGKPTYNVPYNAEEKWAFDTFESPNKLAEALSDKNEVVRLNAIRAMCGIRHVNAHFSDWLISKEYLEKRKKNIFYIGFQETFSADFKALYEKLTRSEFKGLVCEEHKNFPNSTNLSKKAYENLSEWYKNDIILYDYCQMISKKAINVQQK